MKKRVAIIGGGITGLALGYYLAKKHNYEIMIFDKNPTFGGLLGIIQLNHTTLEGSYHHLFKCDQEIISLIEELGIKDNLLYLPSKIGIFYNAAIYPFSTPFDLLTFSPLSFLQRVRLGISILYLQKFIRQNNWQKLSKIAAEKWLKKYAGEKAYKIVWQPLLYGKFGSYAERISLAWLWSRLFLRGKSRDKFGKEELVYIDGGFKLIIDKLIEKIKRSRGTLQPKTKVKQILSNEGKIKIKLEYEGKTSTKLFDACIATIPNPIFVQLTPGLDYQLKQRLLKVKYRAAMVAVFQLKHRFLDKIYWLNINDRRLKLLAVVEHTNFVPANMYGNKHLLYAGNYPAQNDPIMSLPNKQLIKLITSQLEKINPQFNQSWIEKYWVFRDKFAQPVVTTDYLSYLPPITTNIPNLYLVNMAQIYPEDRGTNQAVKAAKQFAQNFPTFK